MKTVCAPSVNCEELRTCWVSPSKDTVWCRLHVSFSQLKKKGIAPGDSDTERGGCERG